MLGREVRFQEFDSKPYEFLDPFPLAEQLLKANGAPANAEGITWLTEEDILKIHEEMIRSFKGEQGIRDPGIISSALERARYSKVAGSDFAPTIIHKAATIMHQILVYHPFVDGQKRTGISAAFIFLGLNGYFMWSRDVMDEVHFAVRVAKTEYDVPEISRWLAARVVPISALGPSALPEFLRFASQRRRQCSLCRRNLYLKTYEITCAGCGTKYTAVLNACLVTRQRGKQRLVVDAGIRMVGPISTPSR
jgi:death-on-curing protein